MGKPQDLVRILMNNKKIEKELSTAEKLNVHIAKTLNDCYRYCNDDQSVDTNKFFEIDSVIDFVHDELNTGHWSEIPLYYRQYYTSASFIKCIIILKNAENLSVNLLQQSLKSLDMGLLLGAPLTDNPDLLTDSAVFLSKQIKILNIDSGANCLKTSSNKRKLTNTKVYSSLNGNEIKSVSCPSLEHFDKNYFAPQIPVKLTGCMDHWPASKKWLDVNYLLSVAGDRTVPIEIGSHYVDENWTQKLMTLGEFITKHYLDGEEAVGYLAQHNLFEQITELKEDIRYPEYCCLSKDYDTSSEPDVNAWLGPQGTVSPLHQDPKNNILCQVYGTKQIILFSPKDSGFLYPHEDRLLSNTAQVNPVAPDLNKHPNFLNSQMFKCLLEPGEMLFIPLKWWHHVTALDKSFSVSFWWQ